MARAHLVLLAATLLAGAASAQSADPPTVVGRIAEVSGAVSYKGAASADWANADRNWPVVAGDAIYAAAGGRSRVEFGPATLTLAQNSEIDFVTVDDKSIVSRADLGSVDLTVAPGHDGLVMVTPRGRVSFGPDGLYRVTVGDATAPTEIVAWRGGASLGDGATRLGAGQMMRLTGDAAAPTVEVLPAPPQPTALAPPLPPAARRVSARIAGYADLQGHGRWTQNARYGEVWYPEVAADWAPYRYGHWRWVAPWGWTWIDDASWGFAPFHYGRWTRLDGRWGWVPGAYSDTAVYSPALVTFVDPPPSAIAVVFAAPVVGWVPLGPGELFRPYYAAGGNYVRQVNINIVTVNGGAGAPVPGGPPGTVAGLQNAAAATIVPAAALGTSAPVAPAALPVQTAALSAAPVAAAGAPPAAAATPPAPVTSAAAAQRVVIPPRAAALSNGQAATVGAGAALGAGAAALAARPAQVAVPTAAASPAAARAVPASPLPVAPPPPQTAAARAGATVASTPAPAAATPATAARQARLAEPARPTTAPGSVPAPSRAAAQTRPTAVARSALAAPAANPARERTAQRSMRAPRPERAAAQMPRPARTERAPRPARTERAPRPKVAAFHPPRPAGPRRNSGGPKRPHHG